MTQVKMTNEHLKPTCCVGMWHLVAGFLMLVLGIYVWFNPLASLIALALYIGIGLIVIGAGYITSSVDADSGWFMFVGILDILIGLILVTNIGVTVATLPIIFALWCLAVGTAQLVSSYRYAKAALPWGWSFALGFLGVVFGFLILKYPSLGAATISTFLGLYIVLYAIVEIMEYFYFKKIYITEEDKPSD